MSALSLHAGCILLGEAGILIRGASGSGKSGLAARLVAARLAKGRFAAHVSDDRTLVEARSGRVVARPHPSIAGTIERRGLGIVRVAHEPAAVLRLVADLTTDGSLRMPEDEDRRTSIAGIALPRLAGLAADIEPLVEEAMSWPT